MQQKKITGLFLYLQTCAHVHGRIVANHWCIDGGHRHANIQHCQLDSVKTGLRQSMSVAKQSIAVFIQ